MNAIRGIAAGFVVLVLILAVVAGLSTGQGRVIFDNILSAGSTTLQWTADQISRLADLVRTRGNSFRSLIAGVVIFAILAVTVPYFRKSAQSVGVLMVIAALAAFVLYDPTILPSV